MVRLETTAGPNGGGRGGFLKLWGEVRICSVIIGIRLCRGGKYEISSIQFLGVSWNRRAVIQFDLIGDV